MLLLPICKLAVSNSGYEISPLLIVPSFVIDPDLFDGDGGSLSYKGDCGTSGNSFVYI